MKYLKSHLTFSRYRQVFFIHRDVITILGLVSIFHKQLRGLFLKCHFSPAFVEYGQGEAASAEMRVFPNPNHPFSFVIKVHWLLNCQGESNFLPLRECLCCRDIGFFFHSLKHSILTCRSSVFGLFYCHLLYSVYDITDEKQLVHPIPESAGNFFMIYCV